MPGVLGSVELGGRVVPVPVEDGIEQLPETDLIDSMVSVFVVPEVPIAPVAPAPLVPALLVAAPPPGDELEELIASAATVVTSTRLFTLPARLTFEAAGAATIVYVCGAAPPVAVDNSVKPVAALPWRQPVYFVPVLLELLEAAAPSFEVPVWGEA